MFESIYDDIVIGAGSAGAVMAARLSTHPNRKVLLLEAGPDYSTLDATPEALRDPNMPVFDGHNWHIPAHSRDAGLLKPLLAAGNIFLRAGVQEQKRMAVAALSAPGLVIGNFDYAVGKVVGGSSAINGALALRGMPEDYDEWARETGDASWSWSSILSTFIALENDADWQAAYHGRAGAIPIAREHRSTLVSLQKAFLDTCLAQGHAWTDDHNAPDATGVGIVPKFVRDRQRMSTAQTHLATIRQRANLTVLPHALVDRLHWQSTHRCGGVDAIVMGERRRIIGERIILCAGALSSPTILMRSGVGKPAELGRLAIPVRIALPGVGDNLRDHPVVGLWAAPEDGVCEPGMPTHQVLLRYTCAGSSLRNDMQIYMLSGLETRLMPMLSQVLDTPQVAAVAACLAKPLSTGALRLASADPTVAPRVLVNCLQEAEDMRRMKEGVRRAWELMQADPVKCRLRQIFAWSAGIFASDSLLEKAIATFVRPGWHVAGTAKMGREDDASAVVDAQGKLFGADNVWLADAAIMPTLPSAPTHLSCVMLSERIAATLMR